jgi:hypothetical protein
MKVIKIVMVEFNLRWFVLKSLVEASAGQILKLHEIIGK